MKYTFDSRLIQETLTDLEQCLNTRFDYMHFEAVSFCVHENSIGIECRGKLRLGFMKEDRTMIYLEIVSLFDELPRPMADHGKIDIEIRIEKWPPWQERKEASEQRTFFNGSLCHHHFAPIEKILFYGNQQSAYLDELNEICTLENLKEWYDIDEMPFMQYESIEFIVLAHNNGKATRIRTEQGGFDIKILEMSELLQDPAEDNYVIVNGYEKNIVLQHQVG